MPFLAMGFPFAGGLAGGLVVGAGGLAVAADTAGLADVADAIVGVTAEPAGLATTPDDVGFDVAVAALVALVALFADGTTAFPDADAAGGPQACAPVATRPRAIVVTPNAADATSAASADE